MRLRTAFVPGRGVRATEYWTMLIPPPPRAATGNAHGPIAEGELLWTPSATLAGGCALTRFTEWLAARRGLAFDDYEALRRWSIDDLEGFWSAIWDFYGVESSQPYTSVLDRRAMPGATWFAGSRVNFSEHILRNESAAPDRPAILHRSELRPLGTLSWRELGRDVRTLATALRGLGVQPGDRVAAYMPNIPETAIALLATTSIGAVWAAAAPEFGAKTVIDRFAQIEPKILFVVDGYRFCGKPFDRFDEIRTIVAALPSVEKVVWLPYLYADTAAMPPPEGVLVWSELLAGDDPGAGFTFERVDARHPLWILFSSGTTGPPKAIVHSHVGMLVEQLKSTGLHLNSGPSTRDFIYTTTGWMVWNALVAGLLQGGSIVLYDGHPAMPGPDVLWKLAAETEATTFGASPSFIGLMQKFGVVPGATYDLSRLEAVLLSGSPATPETFAWILANVGPNLWVRSVSGGTELCSGLVGSVPTLPVYAGEMQARLLGMDVRAWDDDGRETLASVGELVVAAPAPSMPISFWNDPGDERYREAYFEHFPGVWRHGDFLRVNARGGAYIDGRSDATLNRFGVRIGTSEIYRILERIEGVADSLVVCVDLPGGGFFMPLFVSVAAGAAFDDALRSTIARRLRDEGSARHVPDAIYAVPAIPYTLTGKKMEVPVRRILAGVPPEDVACREAMSVPEALDYFIAFAGSPENPAAAAPRPATLANGRRTSPAPIA